MKQESNLDMKSQKKKAITESSPYTDKNKQNT